MPNHGTDHHQKRPTDKQCGELSRIAHGKLAEIVAAYCRVTSYSEVGALLKSGCLAKTIEQRLAPLFAISDPYHALRAYWEKIYRDNYGIKANFSGVYVPELPTEGTEGKWRHLFILKGLSMNSTAAAYKKIIIAHDSRCGFGKYNDDLDATATNNIRTSDESYVICVRDKPEPDKEYLGKSACDADPNQKIGVALLERLVHGLVHFVETKKHLDEVGVTLCTGSRTVDGDVPLVCWNPGSRKVCVGWYDVGSSLPRSGLREAVSA